MTDMINPPTAALVTIDLQARILESAKAPRDGAEVVERSRRLAEEFRARGGLVVPVRAHRPGEQPPGSELVDEPQPGDLLITKHTWGAFHETGLDDELRARGIDTLVITGIATNFGVEQTARIADELGYRLFLAEDAMANLKAEWHRFAVEVIFPALGTVCSTDEVIARLG
ncbi:hydrolase [Actinoallomurus vinaceus]|uniref:Hydrolase n=1 Tax=Actinoallomurus vinaceus TaxID=1080074 RepID=A0ABP8U2N8_9ACTN